jgi:hypothetical protein
MTIRDETLLQAPQKVYLFPTNPRALPGGRFLAQSEALFFQYWPQSLSDEYAVDYVEHNIPGGSHPLYQWSGGRGRTIAFEAVFTSELNTLRTAGSSSLAGAAATAAAASISLLPSAPYTVDVSAALAKIRSWMMPKYSPGGRLGETEPPKILTLVFPNTKLAGSTDLIQVILRSAPITIESWFPNGQVRVATVQLTFNEVVQTPGGGNGQSNATRVKFIGRDAFESEGSKYKFRGLADRPYVGG